MQLHERHHRVVVFYKCMQCHPDHFARLYLPLAASRSKGAGTSLCSHRLVWPADAGGHAGGQASNRTRGGQALQGGGAAEACPPQAPTADVLLLQGALRQAHDTSRRLLQQRACRRKHTRAHRHREQPFSIPARTETSTTADADEAATASAADGLSLTTHDLGSSRPVCLASQPRHRGSRERPATASPAGVMQRTAVAESPDTACCRAGVGSDGRNRCGTACPSPCHLQRLSLSQFLW